jgi:hypothetical protein
LDTARQQRLGHRSGSPCRSRLAGVDRDRVGRLTDDVERQFWVLVDVVALKHSWREIAHD